MSDALERLKNKNRPTVESRDASLVSFNSPDTSISGVLEGHKGGVLEEEKQGGEISLKPQVSIKQDLETKQSTLRLEAKLSDRLQALCREQGICREVLIEAMFEYCEQNSDVLSTILVVATEKNDYRQEIANRRRAKSMMEKFGG
jgi:hypothetical protein